MNGTLDLERESLHISDGTGRICIVETKTVDGGSAVGSPVGIWRYQLGNHLGSAATEVDESGEVISYEEYHPYGTSAYRAVDSSVDVSAKRYRYTGMERDEETGLAYHSARYYVPWLGRWTASDPVGIDDGTNRYTYVRGGPSVRFDITGNATVYGASLQESGQALFLAGQGSVYAQSPAEAPVDPKAPMKVSTEPMLDFLKPMLDPVQYEEGKRVRVMQQGKTPSGAPAETIGSKGSARVILGPDVDIGTPSTTTILSAAILLHELFHANFIDETLPSDVLSGLHGVAKSIAGQQVELVARWGDPNATLPEQRTLTDEQAKTYVSEIAANYIEVRSAAALTYYVTKYEIQQQGELGIINPEVQEMLLRNAAKVYNETVSQAQQEVLGYNGAQVGSGAGIYQLADANVKSEAEAEVKAIVDGYIDELPVTFSFSLEDLR